MKTLDKAEAAFKKHGPMTTRALREHVTDSLLSTRIGQAAKAGRFAVIGGTKNNFIYGMPGQKLPKDDGVDMDAATPRAKPKKAAGGGMPRKTRKKRDIEIRRSPTASERRAEAARQVAGTFRPAIAHDGALLLTGAAQQGELNSAETRVLADFLIRASQSGAMA